ncbi:NHL repeat protein [Anatilimnocola aggregata]|uniref:NHL repeat protein n=1 Tax=Anatilimnocola aggregata TaxID=2528021 RepID=A0A517YMG9_9BACT|nr:twin-arginine translocation signal domain-containing protein [Anatilimnocola aggregata]QDU31412.1 NHL repeat protein [Anatilimnocola aggregata]
MAVSRRKFLQSTAAGVAGAACGPVILGAADKTGTKLKTVGENEFQYECEHNWGQLPSHIKWGDTHGVAIDQAGLIYIKHRNRIGDPMDAIVVFDAEGRFVRSFGDEYHGGGHGIDIRQEGNEEFLYLCDVTHNLVTKTTLKGELVWAKGRPHETDVYKDPKTKYSPTNVAFGPDGGFYIADGYGSHYIHQYNRDAQWIRTWGGAGKDPGQLQTPHGIWLDNRPDREPALVVADRANARLQYFTLDGKFLSMVNEVSFPAHFDIRGDVLLVPDLHARVTLLGPDNKVLTHLGHDVEWTRQVLAGFKMRTQPERWEAGRFIHPHDACFDRTGNIFVVEWVPTGRVTKLRHVG